MPVRSEASQHSLHTKRQGRMSGHLLSTLLLLCTLIVVQASNGLSLQVSQSPKVIALMQLNTSAEISCSATVPCKELHGLSLKRRFNGNIQLFYQYMAVETDTVHQDFKGRISVTPKPGDCCEFTFQLSLLQVADTNGYYCSWEIFDENKAESSTLESNYTLIIVRERNPEEPCTEPSGTQLHRLILGLSAVVCAVMFLIFAGALIWRCLLKNGKYNPHQSSQHKALHHQNHQRRPLPPPPPPQQQHHHHHHHHPQQTQNHHHRDHLLTQHLHLHSQPPHLHHHSQPPYYPSQHRSSQHRRH
ncbi:uncharacterized protein LOC134077025 [Sardina pilchardus]|uniref:uncharacterized protein LOC134077025 n=1 Tax=Sardina pilchardus TaxID=27697 RepID=UPI002E1193B3